MLNKKLFFYNNNDGKLRNREIKSNYLRVGTKLFS